MPDGPPADAEAAYALADTVPGWLTRAQAGVLWSETAALPDGARVVEVGSHLGRSAVVLAAALPPGGRLACVDPFPAAWRYGGPDTQAGFRANLERCGLRDRVDLMVTTSAEARAAWSGRLDLVYVDGKHDALSTADDLRWAAHLPTGGRLLLHDAFSSVGVTLAVLARVVPARRLRYVGRTGSLATLEAARPSLGDRLRVLGPLPWFARNVLVKVLLRLRLHPVAALLGHRDADDPY